MTHPRIEFLTVYCGDEANGIGNQFQRDFAQMFPGVSWVWSSMSRDMTVDSMTALDNFLDHHKPSADFVDGQAGLTKLVYYSHMSLNRILMVVLKSESRT